MGDQCICRSLVPVPNHRNNLHQTRLTSIFVAHELHEADQVSSEKGTDEDASIQEGRVHSSHGLKVFPVVPERLPLTDRGLVVDGVYPPNESIVEGHLPDDDPVFRGFSNLIPDLKSICFVIQSSKVEMRRAAMLSHSIG